MESLQVSRLENDTIFSFLRKGEIYKGAFGWRLEAGGLWLEACGLWLEACG